MKKFIYFILGTAMFLQSQAQLAVRPSGYTVLGRTDLELSSVLNQSPNSRDTITQLKIYGPKFNGGRGRISFGDQPRRYVLNVSVGELGKGEEYDTDMLQLQGKNGTYFTYGVSDTLAYYDVSRGNNFKFNCDITSTGLVVASDKRFKENIQPISDALRTIENLNAVSYNLKPTQSNTIKALHENPEACGEKFQQDMKAFTKLQEQKEANTLRYGFVAQEVKEVMPELVRTDADGYMYVDYIGLVPVLCEAINELKAEIAELTGKDSTPQKAPSHSATDDMLNDKVTPALLQNVPNPFNAETSIKVVLPEDVRRADIYVYDMQGKQILNIPVNERGNSTVTIQGSELPAGMYIYALIADGKEIDSKRMILTK